MSETVEVSVFEKRKPKKDAEWWDTWITHPLDDEQFFAVYVAHLFSVTPDRDIARIRARLFSFVKNFMKLQHTAALAAYRAEYPL